MTRLHYLAARNRKMLCFEDLPACAIQVLLDNRKYPERTRDSVNPVWFPVPRDASCGYHPYMIYRISSKLRPKGIAPEDDPEGRRVL